MEEKVSERQKEENSGIEITTKMLNKAVHTSKDKYSVLCVGRQTQSRFFGRASAYVTVTGEVRCGNHTHSALFLSLPSTAERDATRYGNHMVLVSLGQLCWLCSLAISTLPAHLLRSTVSRVVGRE